MSYFGGTGQPGLPGHGGTGIPQHTATRKDCFDLLWAAPVLATAPIMSMLTATIFRIFFGIAFLLTGRKVSTFALGIHSPPSHSGIFVNCCFQRLSQRAIPQLSSNRKSTRLNSSHLGISYAVFCLKKK